MTRLDSYFIIIYGDLPYLLDVKVDKHLFRALAQFWNPAYSCFTFGRVDLVPTVEEYMALLRCSKFQVEEFEGYNSNAPRREEESGCLRFEYIRFSFLPQSFGTC
ncbi:hypothetical protein Gotur_024422 [Gossypium turneri]